jgi:hypothetical protein
VLESEEEDIDSEDSDSYYEELGMILWFEETPVGLVLIKYNLRFFGLVYFENRERKKKGLYWSHV